MKCGDYKCSLRDPYSGYCSITGCTRSFSGVLSSNIEINKPAIPAYKNKLKENLKNLFAQPGIITEHAIFDVIDKTD